MCSCLLILLQHKGSRVQAMTCHYNFRDLVSPSSKSWHDKVMLKQDKTFKQPKPKFPVLATFTPDIRPTPTNADHILWFGRVWSGKNYPLWAYPSPINSRCIPNAFKLKSQSSWLTSILSVDQSPALHNQTLTYPWSMYAHYAQCKTNPCPVRSNSAPRLKR